MHMKDDLILPVKVTEIINEAVAEIQNELKTADKCEYHLDGIKMNYINGGIDVTFRIRNNCFGLATDIPESDLPYSWRGKNVRKN